MMRCGLPVGESDFLVDFGVKKPGTTELSVQDKDNPKSVINLVPAGVRSQMERIPADLLLMNADELETLLPKRQWTLVDQRLRTAFWIEYNRAQDANNHMNMSNVYSGICARGYFYNYVLENKARLAYLLLPPADYNIAMEEALTYGVDRLREILSMPLYDDKGRPDAKIADVIVKTVQMLDNRVRGAVVQKNLNLNVGANAGQVKPEATPENMEEIERQLSEMRSRFKSQGRLAQEISIEAEHHPLESQE